MLSGRLALSQPLDSADAARELSEFVAEHYERFKFKPVERDELEPMTIVARWLKERAPDEGRVIHLSGAWLDPALLGQTAAS